MTWRLRSINTVLSGRQVLVEGFPEREVVVQLRGRVLTAIDQTGSTFDLHMEDPSRGTVTTSPDNDLRLHYKTDEGSVAWRMRADDPGDVEELRDGLAKIGVTV